MKIKNARMEDIINALMDVSQNRLPGGLALQVARTKRAVAEQYADVLEARSAMIIAHGGTEEEGISPDHENWGLFASEYDALMDAETEVDAKPLPVADLTAEGSTFRPDSLGLLDFVGLLED